MSKNKGFIMAELIVVFTIIAILIKLTNSSYHSITKHTKELNNKISSLHTQSKTS
ncbi:MAG: type II secretion system protein [Legionellales bacterium]|jgi:Tfp pilus assembly protein PilE|nr:type II secretion system protein [Legionellales bacterium]